MIVRVIVFLAVNFAALGLGIFFTSKGINSLWYNNLNAAPWTPPGWVFGAAWTAVMICFAIYMAHAWQSEINKTYLITCFSIQWILNVAWNPVFFHLQAVLIALIIIISLTLLIGYFLFDGYQLMGLKTLWVAPYFIWLIIATSLNAYIYVFN